MKISKEEVSHIALLSRLSLSETEAESFREHLSKVLSYVENLDAVDTENVEPTAHVLNVRNSFRKDINHTSLTPDEALSNSPGMADNFYKVPKIIE